MAFGALLQVLASLGSALNHIGASGSRERPLSQQRGNAFCTENYVLF